MQLAAIEKEGDTVSNVIISSGSLQSTPTLSVYAPAAERTGQQPALRQLLTLALEGLLSTSETKE